MAQNIEMPRFAAAGGIPSSADAWGDVDNLDVDLLAEYLLEDGKSSSSGGIVFDFNIDSQHDSTVVSPENSEDGVFPPIAEASHRATAAEAPSAASAAAQQAPSPTMFASAAAPAPVAAAPAPPNVAAAAAAPAAPAAAFGVPAPAVSTASPTLAPTTTVPCPLMIGSPVSQAPMQQQQQQQQAPAAALTQFPGLSQVIPALALQQNAGAVADPQTQALLLQLQQQQQQQQQQLQQQQHQQPDLSPPAPKRPRIDEQVPVMAAAGAPVAGSVMMNGQQHMAVAAAAAAAAVQMQQPGRGGRKKTQAQINRRRERNRILARKTRLRKKFFFESLQKEVMDLQRENRELKEVVKLNIDAPDAKKILDDCDASERLPEGVLEACGQNAAEMNGQDFSLVQSIQSSQHSFVITDPSLPDNPIVFASDDFLKLTGYSREQVLGRNCRFLQGTDTDQGKVEQVRKAISAGDDVTVTMLNYTADGTPFWNKLFIAALRDAQSNIVNYIGVIVKVAAPEPGDPEHEKARQMAAAASAEKGADGDEDDLHDDHDDHDDED